MNEVYCEYCGAEPPYHTPCRQSDSGSHRPRQRGELRYRVQGPDGYIYLVTRPRDGNGWKTVEVITY